MDRSRLVPEKRVDKNGRLVTRLVRSGPGGAAGGTPSIPGVPVLPEARTHEELAEAVYGKYPELKPSAAAQLVHLSEPLLQALHEAGDTPEAVKPLAAILRTVLLNLLRYTRIPPADEMRRIEVIAQLAPFDSILEDEGTFTGNWNVADHVADALADCGLNWYDPLTEENLAAAKAELLAAKFSIRPEMMPELPDSEWEDGKGWARTNMAEIERWLRPLSLTGKQYDGYPHRWSELQEAIDAARSSGCDPDRLAAFMAERRIRDIAAAADALRGIHGALQDGTL